MYSAEQLSKYSFFKETLKDNKLEWILDPLTGVISRSFFLNFVKSLINDKTPFTFGIVDLDNFKFINDNYGHHVGDLVLRDIGENLANYYSDIGLIGRFGGDEFLFVDFKHLEYDDKKQSLKQLYVTSAVLRKNIPLETCNPFITATVGCATYPLNTDNYDDLFALIDKALYRGKTKGRNCYIIYVEEKHANITMSRLGKRGIYTSMQRLVRQFEMVNGLDNKIHSIMPFLMEELVISDLYYVSTAGRMKSFKDRSYSEEVGDIRVLCDDDVYTENFIENSSANLCTKCPQLFEALKKKNAETLLVVRIAMDMDVYGYLLMAEPNSHRIWQEEECALVYMLAKLIAMEIKLHGFFM